MTRRSVWTYPWPLRDRLILGLTIGYFLLLLLSISNIVPLRSYIQDHARTNPVLGRMLSDLQAVPYIGRVERVMREKIKAPETEIAQKVEFLTASYLIILGGYGLLAIGMFAGLLALGIWSDPVNEFLQLNGDKGLRQTAIICLIPLVAINAALVYSFIRGARTLSGDGGGLPDCITSSNLCISATIPISSLSLLFTLYTLRVLLGWLYSAWAFRRGVES